jgi:hypothetical protein
MRARHIFTALVIAIVAATAACTSADDGNGVATAQSPGQTSSPSADGASNAQAFAACLRERGIDVADPRPGEQVEIPAKDDETRDALRACARFAPPSQQRERGLDPAAARAYAGCIREQGFPDFPDPDANGLRIPKDLIGNEQFEAADRECAPLLNESKGGKQ